MANIYFETTTSFICGGQYAAIVNHWKADSAGLSGNPFLDAEDLIDALSTNTLGGGDSWTILLANMLADECFVSAIRARQLTAGGGPTAVTVFGAGDFPGTFGGEMEAFQTAGTIVWACDSNDAFRGWNRVPGVSNDGLFNNRFTAQYHTDAEALIDGVLLGFQEATPEWTMVVKGFAGGVDLYRNVIGGYLAPTPGHIKSRRVPV